MEIKSIAIISLLAAALVSCAKPESQCVSFGDLGDRQVATGEAVVISASEARLFGSFDTGISKMGGVNICFFFTEEIDAASFDYDKYLRNGTGAVRIFADYEGYKMNADLKGLAPDRTYYFRAAAVNGKIVYLGEVRSFHTMGSDSVFKITTIDTDETAYVSATLKAELTHKDVLSNEALSGISLGFLCTSEEADARSMICTEDPNYNPSTCKSGQRVNYSMIENDVVIAYIDGLKPESRYFYKAFMKFGNEYIYSDKVCRFTTKAISDIPIKTLEAGNCTNGSAILYGECSYTEVMPLVVSGMADVGFLISGAAIPESIDPAELRVYSGYGVFGSDIYMLACDVFTDGNRITSSVSGLSSNTTYYYCSFLKVNGVVLKGSVKSFTTEESKVSYTIEYNDRWQNNGNTSFYSTNNTSNSTSVLRILVTHDAGVYLSFSWGVSSESGYDILMIAVNGNQFVYASGEDAGNVYHEFTYAGTSEIVFQYSKDGSNDSGRDFAWIDNFRVY